MSNQQKITFGVRLPNSGPLASPQSMLQVARKPKRSVSIRSGCTII